MSWLLEHWTHIVEAVSLFMALASAITRLTPTPKDDEWFAGLRRLLSRASLLEHNDSLHHTVKAPGRMASTRPPPHPDDIPMD